MKICASSNANKYTNRHANTMEDLQLIILVTTMHSLTNIHSYTLDSI